MKGNPIPAIVTVIFGGLTVLALTGIADGVEISGVGENSFAHTQTVDNPDLVGQMLIIEGIYHQWGVAGVILGSRFAEGHIVNTYYYISPNTPIKIYGQYSDNTPLFVNARVTAVALYGYAYEVDIHSADINTYIKDELADQIQAIETTVKEQWPAIQAIDLYSLSNQMAQEYMSDYRLPDDGYQSLQWQIVGYDNENKLVLYRAQGLRLPPEESHQLERYLEVYAITSLYETQPAEIFVSIHGQFLE
jgi:hypothetical protein